MTERIHLSAPDVGDLEEQYVVAAMRSGWVAPAGPDLDAFERAVAERVGVAAGVGLASGTAGLHLGLLAIGVAPGDVVVTSTMTFAATANAITYTGAEPFFIDSLESSGNLDPELLERALAELTAAGRRIGAIVPVDLFGKAVDYTAVEGLAGRFGIPVLGDAAESLGARHGGRATGSFGRASVVSFNGNKVMTTSSGGMFLTDDVELAARVRYLSTQARQPTVHYEHTEIGYNYRLSNILAALGRAQLLRLDDMIARRRALRTRYSALFADRPGLRLLGSDDDADDNCWLTSIVVDPEVAGWSAAELGEAMTAADIESRPLWKPMHLQPVFRDSAGLITGVAERLFRNGLTLPSGSSLDDTQLDRIAREIGRFLESRS